MPRTAAAPGLLPKPFYGSGLTASSVPGPCVAASWQCVPGTSTAAGWPNTSAHLAGSFPQWQGQNEASADSAGDVPS